MAGWHWESIRDEVTGNYRMERVPNSYTDWGGVGNLVLIFLVIYAVGWILSKVFGFVGSVFSLIGSILVGAFFGVLLAGIVLLIVAVINKLSGERFWVLETILEYGVGIAVVLALAGVALNMSPLGPITDIISEVVATPVDHVEARASDAHVRLVIDVADGVDVSNIPAGSTFDVVINCVNTDKDRIRIGITPGLDPENGTRTQGVIFSEERVGGIIEPGFGLAFPPTTTFTISVTATAEPGTSISIPFAFSCGSSPERTVEVTNPLRIHVV